jgi:transcriptional regulator with XRE-family HTH domain
VRLDILDRRLNLVSAELARATGGNLNLRANRVHSVAVQNAVTEILLAMRRAIRTSGKARGQILKEAGINQSQLARLMKGGGGLSLARLERFAEVLGLEIIVRPRSKKTAILNKPVESLGLSVRAQHCLTQHPSKPICTVRQLINCSEASLAAFPNSGPLVVEEVRGILARHGFRLRDQGTRRRSAV